MPQKWAIEFGVEGDLRFLSHHDMMRAMERLVRRACLPLRYSQGFNPRPSLSLTMPRPVGVASRADLMVLAIEEDIESQVVLDRMNATSPRGLRCTRACKLASNPRPRTARYELPLAEDRLGAVRARLDELAGQDSWPLERKTSQDPDSKSPSTTINLRKLVPELRLEGSQLVFILAPSGESWAKPSEVLTLLGLDARVDLAGVVRTAVDYGLNEISVTNP